MSELFEEKGNTVPSTEGAPASSGGHNYGTINSENVITSPGIQENPASSQQTASTYNTF